MTMKKLAIALLGMLPVLCVACATPPSAVDESFGSAEREIVASQVANPDAGKDTAPVEGLSPSTAADVSANYHDRQTVEYQRDNRESTLGLINEE